MPTESVVDRIDAAIAERSLLDHPFYQDWNEGALDLDALRTYAGQYIHFEAAFPILISAIHARCEDRPIRRVLLENLWDEEWGTDGTDHHYELWLRFAEGLGMDRAEVEEAEPLPETRALVDGFRSACFTRPTHEGVAALYAYESQIPDVAEQKIAGLKEFYDITDERTLSFFTVHREADLEHSDAEREILERACRTEQDADEAVEAARVAADRLWMFLDGAYREGATAPVAS